MMTGPELPRVLTNLEEVASASQTSQGSAAKTKSLLGSFNYVFSAAVLAEGGRGIGVNLALTYNSRVWTKETGGMTFNYAKGWPAPGYTLGYGRLIDNYDNQGNWLLIQADGTRIHLQTQPDGTLASTDGTFITLNPTNGKLRYPDGTLIYYSNAQNFRWLPVTIRSRNGDQINIAYKQYQKHSDQAHYFPVRWAISQINDSLGRNIIFHYYGDPDDPSYPADTTGAKSPFALAVVTAPDQVSGTRTLVQLDYQGITLQYDFSVPVDQINNPASGSQIIVPRRVYYPATGGGYLS